MSILPSVLRSLVSYYLIYINICKNFRQFVNQSFKVINTFAISISHSIQLHLLFRILSIFHILSWGLLLHPSCIFDVSKNSAFFTLDYESPISIILLLTFSLYIGGDICHLHAQTWSSANWCLQRHVPSYIEIFIPFS